MIACLRAAVTITLFSDPPKPPAVIDVLVQEWLGLRNLSHADFQQIRALHHRFLLPLLRLAPKVWSAKRNDESLQELSRMIFTKALANQGYLIGDMIRSWFRLVPTAGSVPFQGRMEDPAAEIRHRTADLNLTGLHLRIHGDEGILALHRVGLYLLSKVPDLAGPDALLALMAAQEIAGDYPRGGDCFVIRRALAHTSVTWFKEQMRLLSRNPTGRRREILYWLITCAAREDLQAYEEATKPATDPWQELQYQFSRYDRARYDELRTRSFSADEDLVRFVELARHMVRDPDLPKPCQERITAISEVLPDTFFKAELLRESFGTAEDYKFEQMLPAVAAWVPDIGAAIVRQQIEGLPARAPGKQRGWAFRLDQDAVLADGSVRSALLTLLSVPSTTDEDRRALDRILGVLLPGMQPRERIDALIDLPPERMEWTDLYRQLVADLMHADEVAYALSRWRHEENPLYRRRLLRLLAKTRHLNLTASDIERFANDITNGNDEDQFYALSVAVSAQVTSLPLEILLPPATETNNLTSRIPDYAAWLVVHGDAFAHTSYKGKVEQLPLCWRALASTKKADLRAIFLQELEQVLCNDAQVDAELARRVQEHRTCWSSHEFPQLLMAQMCEQDPARFEAWMDALLVDKRKASFWWGGLLKPMFQVAIRTGHPRTKELWPLVFPFQRGPVAIGPRFLIRIVHELSDPSANQEIAIDLLTDLVYQSLSDWELFQIALGARHQSQARLFTVVKALLGNSDPEVRARAVRIAGWLEDMGAECAQVERSDPSLWVRRVAMLALESAKVETWARRWFDTFLNGANPATRWGGGQLFLTCVDGRFRVWAWSLVNQPGLAARIRGEAILLLNAAEQSAEKKDRALQETFLRHKIADLRAVCHPWHPEVDWKELEATR